MLCTFICIGFGVIVVEIVSHQVFHQGADNSISVPVPVGRLVAFLAGAGTFDWTDCDIVEAHWLYPRACMRTDRTHQHSLNDQCPGLRVQKYRCQIACSVRSDHNLR